MKNIDEIKNNIIADDIIKKFYNDDNFWFEISQRSNLSENFIEKYKDKLKFTYLDFSNVSENFIINNKDLIMNRDVINKIILTKQNLSEDIIKLFVPYLFFHPMRDDGWSRLCTYQKLSINFLTKYIKYIDWKCISKYQDLFDELILKFNKYISWDEISKRNDLTIEFLQKYSKNIKFSIFFEYTKLNETFCEEIVQKCKNFFNYYTWYNLFRYQQLSDNFINRYSNDISNYDIWPTVFRYQDYGKFMEA